MDKTKIEWAEATWNPLRGCTRISEGCRNCYAENMAGRFSGFGNPYHGVVRIGADGPRWTGVVRRIPEKMDEPLRWRRPRRIFVNSMSDTFHALVDDLTIGEIWDVMRRAPRHTFMVLTKRAERMHSWCSKFDDNPLVNVSVGVSIENQRAVDERMSFIVDTVAASRFLSVEPLLERVDLSAGLRTGRIDLVIVGGESGREARPCDVAWIRSVVEQCARFDVPCFVKQLGSRPRGDDIPFSLNLTNKNGDPSEWPFDIRVRQMPTLRSDR